MKAFDRGKVNLIFVNICFALLIALAVALNGVAVYWSGALESYFGFIGASGIGPYESEYTNETLLQAEIDTATKIVEDGSVLLKNENSALPLSGNEKITLFGVCSYSWVGTSSYGSAGSASSKVTLKEALESKGFQVNDAVWNYYESSGVRYVGSSYDLKELPFNSVEAATSSSFSGYNDAAILVFGRVGGEGEDLPVNNEYYGGQADENMAELTSVELGLIRQAKASGFKKVIVVLNTAYAMEVDYLDTGADAVLVVPGTGNYGIYGVANILTGTNPSGHLVDTYVYDNFSSPAVQNMSFTSYLENGSRTSNAYVYYAEGIYVGYKYYETRYEDVVTNRANVGEYDYSKTVAYPFGYGLSYTEFSYSDYSIKEKNGKIEVSLTVRNDGSVAGKDAVGIYFQSPYTQYDIQNKVEKATVNLAAFAKTDVIEPGKTQKVTVSFAIDDMKSYDYKGAKSYIMDNGTYYITAARDAHEAANNILAKRGVNASALKAAGETELTYDSNFVSVYEEQGNSPRIINKDDNTGADITNRFGFAEGDGKYLSRNKWSDMDGWNRETLIGGISQNTGSVDNEKGKVGTREINSEVSQKLSLKGWESSERPENTKDNSEALFEQQTGLVMADSLGADYDDEIWLQLTSTCTFAELHGMFNRAGYNTKAIESINKPATSDVDGPPGLASFVADWTGFSFPSETSIAQTWETDYAKEMGSLVAEDAFRIGVSGWYAPGANIHRTPFGGRNAEYYSEDAAMSGYFAASTVTGAQNKGLTCYIKHFALNEHETNRNTYSSWANEQTIREIYLRPFEMAVKLADCHGVMTSMNKIGYIATENSYALVTAVLRNEWGFEGAVITDYTSSADAEACLAAGVDLILSTTAIRLADTSKTYVRNEIKQAAKHTLYMVSRSNVMNIFLDGNTSYSAGIPVYVILLIIIDVAAVAGIVLGEMYAIQGYRKSRKIKAATE